MLLLCRKNLSQSEYVDYKILTIEGEKNVFWMGSPTCYQCFEIQ
jgi:hypothetical protein